MAAEGASIWVIVLNWNGLEDTLACLASLRAVEAAPYRLQVLVVDSASALDPRPALAAAFPAARVERLARNLGFTGGCNHGMAVALAAGADYIVLLNNDTLVEPGFLRPLVDQLAQDASAGVVGPLIGLLDQPERIWFAGATFGLATGRSPHWGLGRPMAAVQGRPFATDYISGCCLVARARDLRRHGLLDAGYFAYYEDVELCLRLRRAGLRAVCVPQSRIWHKVSASSGREGRPGPFAYYFGQRNRIATVLRYAGPARALCFVAVANPLRVAYYLAALAAGRRWKELAWLVLGLLHGLQGRLGGPPG